MYRANFNVCQKMALKRSSRSGRNVGKSVFVSERNMRGFQKVSSHIFFLVDYLSKKIEKNTGRFVTKFFIFPCNSLANLNTLYIVYVTIVNQRDSTQHPNFGSTPQPLL